VDKVVDKPLLTSRKASTDAGFNNLPFSQAIFLMNKINDLQGGYCPTTKLPEFMKNIFCCA
jgi:hypothetical protein